MDSDKISAFNKYVGWVSGRDCESIANLECKNMFFHS